jgi:hypothetical protein
LAQCGGTVNFRAQSIPYISLGKLDYVLLDSFVSILQPITKTMTILQRRALCAQSHEIDYLRLVQFYQRKYHQDDSIVSNQQQLLIRINDIYKYLNENDLGIDMLLTQYQQVEYQKLRKQTETIENQPIRKPTKRKSSSTMTELQNTITEK